MIKYRAILSQCPFFILTFGVMTVSSCFMIAFLVAFSLYRISLYIMLTWAQTKFQNSNIPALHFKCNADTSMPFSIETFYPERGNAFCLFREDVKTKLFSKNRLSTLNITNVKFWNVQILEIYSKGYFYKY